METAKKALGVAGGASLGVTAAPFIRSGPAAVLDLARRAERLGYGSFWVAEVTGVEAFSVLGAVSRAAPGLGLGTGVLPMQVRTPPLLAMAAASVQALAPGRDVLLGVGVSSPVVAGDWHGAGYPVSAAGPDARAVHRRLLRRGDLSGDSIFPSGRVRPLRHQRSGRDRASWRGARRSTHRRPTWRQLLADASIFSSLDGRPGRWTDPAGGASTGGTRVENVTHGGRRDVCAAHRREHGRDPARGGPRTPQAVRAMHAADVAGQPVPAVLQPEPALGRPGGAAGVPGRPMPTTRRCWPGWAAGWSAWPATSRPRCAGTRRGGLRRAPTTCITAASPRCCSSTWCRWPGGAG